jgi:adenylate cyclase
VAKFVVMRTASIRVLLADDSIIVRQGVRALIELAPDLEVVGEAADYDSLLAAAERTAPDVVVTDIRMPPTFQMEGIRAALELRKRRPGLAAVVLSQYVDPEYALALLGDGAAGLAYLLKDRVAEGDQLIRAIRVASTGGSLLDPKVMEGVLEPVAGSRLLAPGEEELLRQIAEGRSLKAIAAARRSTAAMVSSEVESLLLKIARDANAGSGEAVRHLRHLLRAMVELEEQSETLSRLLPSGLVQVLREKGARTGETERLVVTVLMSDVRGYSGIAERTDPAVLAGQLNEHRGQMSHAVLQHGGTVMQFVGDAVLAVFGAPLPQPGHENHALAAAVAMQSRQETLNQRWQDSGLDPFGLGIALSTGEVAAALLGSDERLEYSVVGDVVNLSQRLQEWARPGELVLSEPTLAGLSSPIPAEHLEPRPVKGRKQPIGAYRVAAAGLVVC